MIYCYLCKSDSYVLHEGVRDNASINVLKCNCCGLVFLSSLEHITEGFYEDGGMFEKIDNQYISTLFDRTFGSRNRWLKRFSEITYTNNLNGNCAEGGVFEGFFAKEINAAFPDRTLYLFDTFEGFDKRDIEKETNEFVKSRTGGLNVGVEIDSLISKMSCPDNIVIRKGYFPETAEGINDEFIFVNLDFDLYAPTLSGLEFFYPKMGRGGNTNT